jgi:heat shock protein HslJ
MKRFPVLIVLTVGLLAACAQTADPVAGGADPASGAAGGDAAVSSDMVKPVGGDLRIGKPWYLVGGMLAESPSSDVTLTFEEKTVGGQGPVNSYAADYTATSTGGLTFGVFASTLMAGPDAEMAAEAELLATLDKVDGYTTVEAGELYLFEGDMNVLTYSATPVTAQPTISDATQKLSEGVVGLPEDEAQAAIEGAGLTYRVIARDGKALAATDDYSVTRINVAVDEGTVTEATIG